MKNLYSSFRVNLVNSENTCQEFQPFIIKNTKIPETWSLRRGDRPVYHIDDTVSRSNPSSVAGLPLQPEENQQSRQCPAAPAHLRPCQILLVSTCSHQAPGGWEPPPSFGAHLGPGDSFVGSRPS